jgi:hypothetical protein
MSTADATGDSELTPAGDDGFPEYPAHHDAGFEGPEEPAPRRPPGR